MPIGLPRLTTNRTTRYNSAVYPVLSSHDYLVYAVNQAFVDDTECRNCTDGTVISNLWKQSKSNDLEKLMPADCLNEYGIGIQSYRRNLLLVVGDGISNMTSVDETGMLPYSQRQYDIRVNNTNVYSRYGFDAYQAMTSPFTPFAWIFTGDNVESSRTRLGSYALGEIKRSPESWRVGLHCGEFYGYCNIWPVQYCLSEPAEQVCKLMFSAEISIIVTCLNFCKYLVPMCFTLAAEDYFSNKSLSRLQRDYCDALFASTSPQRHSCPAFILRLTVIFRQDSIDVLRHLPDKRRSDHDDRRCDLVFP